MGDAAHKPKPPLHVSQLDFAKAVVREESDALVRISQSLDDRFSRAVDAILNKFSF